MNQLPLWLDSLLNDCPKAGAGVHKWLFQTSRHLHAHIPAGEIIRLLEKQTANCGRHVAHREIVSAVQDALACAWEPSGHVQTTTPERKWPALNREQREAILRDGGGLADLWECSPLRFDDDCNHTEQLIDQLFPGDPLLCCGRTSYLFSTRTREQWRGELADLALIVPSPMTAPTGTTKDGKESAHSLDNTGSRRFLITEFDQGTIDEHAAILMHLAGYAPLLLAVHSGGKSLHGWFLAAGFAEEKVERFFRYAVSLGADPATWTRSQFVRMPDGTRDNGQRQTVFFFNPLLLKSR